MRRVKALFAVVAVVTPLCLAVGVPAAHGSTPGYNVFVGYADDVRSGIRQSPTPWAGATGVTFAGATSNNDAGAIRVANATAVTETVDFVTLNIGGCIFDLWPHGVAMPGGGQIIVTQTLPGAGNGCTPGTITGPSNMDTSDIGANGAQWAGVCTNSYLIPSVTVSVDGTATTYPDAGRVLNTGGVDGASCSRDGFPAGNETTQWVSIGQPPCPTGAALTLVPANQTDIVGATATVTANLSACGSPLQGATVNFAVLAGPNTGGSASAVADGNGNASFSYSSAITGSDTVQAAVTNLAGTIPSNTATVDWQRRPTTLSYNGATTSDFNDPAVLSATLTDSTAGTAIGGQPVTLTMAAESCPATTDTTGTATCAVTPSEAAGTYTVTASFSGTTQYLPSSTSAGFTVTREETALAYTGPTIIANNQPVTVSGVLTTDSAPLSGRPVTFSIGTGPTTQTCTATSAPSGSASCTIATLNQPVGSHLACTGTIDLSGSAVCSQAAVAVSFAGDDFYRPASATGAALLATIACTANLTGTITSALILNSGTTCLNGATVKGAVLVNPGAGIVVLNSTINGAVVTRGSTAVTMCNSTAGGGLTISGTTGFVLVGAGNDATFACPANTLLGAVVLGGSGTDANTGGVELGGNTITVTGPGGVAGSVVVNGNRPAGGGTPIEDMATEIEGNHIFGGLACNTNTPAPVNDNQPNTVTGARTGQCAHL
jgi:hypothetical protein